MTYPAKVCQQLCRPNRTRYSPCERNFRRPLLAVPPVHQATRPQPANDPSSCSGLESGRLGADDGWSSQVTPGELQ